MLTFKIEHFAIRSLAWSSVFWSNIS